jgi:hypothetical protein
LDVLREQGFAILAAKGNGNDDIDNDQDDQERRRATV